MVCTPVPSSVGAVPVPVLLLSALLGSARALAMALAPVARFPVGGSVESRALSISLASLDLCCFNANLVGTWPVLLFWKHPGKL